MAVVGEVGQERDLDAPALGQGDRLSRDAVVEALGELDAPQTPLLANLAAEGARGVGREDEYRDRSEAAWRRWPGDALLTLGLTTLAAGPAEVDGIPVLVARAGWSKQGGYELYLRDGSRGTDLWNLIMAAGEPYGIGPGAPNYVERIESNLLSFRADTVHVFDIENGKVRRFRQFTDTALVRDAVG